MPKPAAAAWPSGVDETLQGAPPQSAPGPLRFAVRRLLRVIAPYHARKRPGPRFQRPVHVWPVGLNCRTSNWRMTRIPCRPSGSFSSTSLTQARPPMWSAVTPGTSTSSRKTGSWVRSPSLSAGSTVHRSAVPVAQRGARQPARRRRRLVLQRCAVARTRARRPGGPRSPGPGREPEAGLRRAAPPGPGPAPARARSRAWRRARHNCPAGRVRAARRRGPPVRARSCKSASCWSARCSSASLRAMSSPSVTARAGSCSKAWYCCAISPPARCRSSRDARPAPGRRA